MAFVPAGRAARRAAKKKARLLNRVSTPATSNTVNRADNIGMATVGAGVLGATAAVYSGISSSINDAASPMMETLLGDAEADQLTIGRDLSMEDFYALPHINDIASSLVPFEVPTFKPFGDYPQQYRDFMEIKDHPSTRANYEAISRNTVAEKYEQEFNYMMGGGNPPSYRRASQLPSVTGGMVFGMHYRGR
jgi:hypothetical protein